MQADLVAANGYRLHKELRRSRRATVWEAVRESDGEPVVLKAYAEAEDPTGTRTCRELGILRSLEGSGTIRALDLLEDVSPPVLVLERVPGESLLSWVQGRSCSPGDFLEIASQLADLLGRIHDARILHRDLHPGNVIVDPADLRTHLVDFGSARPVLRGTERDVPSVSVLDVFAGPVAFIAPEQTGRMDRGVDVRSDLYALGATLYYVATGLPPFEGTDALALIHAHMARMPEKVVDRRPEFPETLSRIVMKLLEKEPEDRYQTAQALHADLVTCSEQLRSAGRIDAKLVLGGAHVPSHPLFAKRLYGRESELQALEGAYVRACTGSLQWVLLSGEPGSGKSALVNELRAPIAASGGFVASGKFDLYRHDVPYSGWQAALDSLVQQLLIQPEEQLAQWREALHTALGRIAGALVTLVPDLAAVLGEVPDLPNLGPRETQARLLLAVQRFLHGCAQTGHPLVLFLDDIQWADAGSLALLEALEKLVGVRLLVVVAYRAGELDEAHPLSRLLARLDASESAPVRIHLDELSALAVQEMLADATRNAGPAVEALARTVVRRTGSSPLRVQQFVLHLHSRGLLRFELRRGCWIWDDAEVASAVVPEGAVPILTAKLVRIEPSARELIELASCVGHEFDLSRLVSLSGRAVSQLEPALYTLLDEGLLCVSPRGFRFAHDRIREAAQALLPTERREQLHMGMASLLEASEGEQRDDFVFELADHWNLAGNLLGEENRRRALDANRRAGVRALRAGTAATADRYLGVALSHLSGDDHQRDLAGVVELLVVSAEAATQHRKIERALSLLDRAASLPVDRARRIRVQAQRVTALSMSDNAAALDLAFALLREVGINIPRRPSRIRVLLSLWLTARWVGNAGEDRFRARPSFPERELQRLVIRAAGAPILTAGLGPVTLLANRSLRLERNLANPDRVGTGLASLANAFLSMGNSWRRFERYVHATQGWLARFPGPPTARTECILRVFSLPLMKPRRPLALGLESTEETLREIGDAEYAGFAFAARVLLLALSGECIDSFLRLAAGSPIAAMLVPYGLLQQGDLDQVEWAEHLRSLEVRIGALPAFRVTTLRLHWLVVLCVARQYELAWKLAERMEPDVNSANAYAGSMLDFRLYQGICAAVLARQAKRRQRRRFARVLRRNLAVLRTWAGRGPDVGPLHAFLEAEQRALRVPAPAVHAYLACADQARAHGLIQLAALAYERQADLQRTMGRTLESHPVIERACAAYQEWGAAAKADQLRQRLGSSEESRLAQPR